MLYLRHTEYHINTPASQCQLVAKRCQAQSSGSEEEEELG